MTRLTEIKSEPVKSKHQEYYPPITKLEVTNQELIAFLKDGRKTSIPREWLNKPNFFNLNNATTQQLKYYEILADGKTIYWPEIDEYLHVRTFIDGLNARCCW